MGCDLPNVNPYDDHSTAITGYVEIDSGAPVIAREEAFGFDAECLTRRSGCASIAQLLPTAWQQAGQNTVKCIIPNREGVFDMSQGK